MSEPTDALFTNSAVSRLLDLAAASRRPGGAPLEDELDRFCRTLRDGGTLAWAVPLAAVTALLELLAEDAASPRGRTRPAAHRDLLAGAAGDAPAPAFLRSLAARLRDRERELSPGLDALPLSQWEALARFGLIDGFTHVFESGDHDDLVGAAREAAASEHPSDCHGRIAALAGELQRTLLMFPRPHDLDAAFARVMPEVTHPRLRALLDAVLEHFAEAH
ncbi:hypothetical protein ACIQWR_29280 [Streptomyces sp. NPDC098789]|uniref:hypothetical protein n=1 Tax=Streptomyces sp. NPDC098789 TaxID=3366098 RepID=UPI00382496CB